MPKYITCPQCQLMKVNGYIIHEKGCPNDGAKLENGEWVKYYKCFNCGFDVKEDEECNCMEEIEE